MINNISVDLKGKQFYWSQLLFTVRVIMSMKKGGSDNWQFGLPQKRRKVIWEQWENEYQSDDGSI